MEDATRFLIENRSVVEKTPLQVYSAAPIFSPERSRVKSLFQNWNWTHKWIKTPPAVPVDWSPLLRSLEGHSSAVIAVAFSPDGDRLAYASSNKKVRLWDPGTGASYGILEGHPGWVLGVAFSPDGHCLAAIFDNEVVRLWGIRTQWRSKVCTKTPIYDGPFLQPVFGMLKLESQQILGALLLLHVREENGYFGKKTIIFFSFY